MKKAQVSIPTASDSQFGVSHNPTISPHGILNMNLQDGQAQIEKFGSKSSLGHMQRTVTRNVAEALNEDIGGPLMSF